MQCPIVEDKANYQRIVFLFISGQRLDLYIHTFDSILWGTNWSKLDQYYIYMRKLCSFGNTQVCRFDPQNIPILIIYGDIFKLIYIMISLCSPNNALTGVLYMDQWRSREIRIMEIRIILVYMCTSSANFY